jgi:hypothetical protein
MTRPWRVPYVDVQLAANSAVREALTASRADDEKGRTRDYDTVYAVLEEFIGKAGSPFPLVLVLARQVADMANRVAEVEGKDPDDFLDEWALQLIDPESD